MPDPARRGATLVELSVVLVVTSTLLAIAFPRIQGFLDGIAVRAAVTEIESIFSLGRHVAIARGTQSHVDIDAANGVFTLSAGGVAVSERAVGAIHGVAISTNRTSMTWSPIGVGYGAANFSMIVRRGSRADTVVVSRLGRVRH